MNSVQQLEIEALTNIVAVKRMRYQMIGMQNINGLDEAQRIHRSMEYSQAQSEFWNAESALRLALEKVKP